MLVARVIETRHEGPVGRRYKRSIPGVVGYVQSDQAPW